MVVEKSKYLVSHRIYCGSFFGMPEKDGFITMREPSTSTVFELEAAFKKGDPKEIARVFVAEMPGLISEHNFYGTDGGMLTGAQVATVVSEKLDLFMHVLQEYKAKVLFTLGKKSTES